MTNSGSVAAGRDIYAEIINTGLIIDRPTINLILNDVNQLAELLKRPEVRLALSGAQQLTVVAGDQQLVLPPGLPKGCELLARDERATDQERQQAYAAWLVTRRPERPPQLVAARDYYIPLAGYLSREEAVLQPHFSEQRQIGEGAQRRIERERLADVTEAIARHPAFVLLGAPGSGKSTVLQRLALQTARDFLTGQGGRLPLLLTLADYHRWQQEQAPLNFVRHRWQEQTSDDFVTLVRSGRILLLADGLNEMPRLAGSGRQRARVGAWERFINDYFAEARPDSSRAILTSRDQDDYDQPLGLPRVEIEALDEAQIRRFVEAYLPGQVEPFLAAIERLNLQPQARVPYALFILTQRYDPAAGDLPPNRGRLFAAYAQSLLQGEKDAGHPWYDLEAALAALAELGYSLQDRGESTVLTATALQALLPPTVPRPGQLRPAPTPPEAVFTLACRAGLLSPDPTAAQADAYKFSHQLLQEQFAAHGLLARWQAGQDQTGLWRTDRTPAEMPDPAGGEWDPLPPPPATGWEQATILAAGITDRPDDFVRAVLAVNPALAGRCLVEGAAPAGPDTRRLIQQALLADLGNPTLHRRTRLQAGQVLGAVGDPRFVPVEINGVRLIVPDLVAVPPGPARLGSHSWPWDRQAYANERPRHPVAVAGFYLARTLLTNAEFACFIQAGGYETEPYWTASGWQWRQGNLQQSGLVEDWLERRQYVLENPRFIEQMLKEKRWRPETAATYRYLVSLSEEEARRVLLENFPIQAHEQPHYWTDPAYNRPNQPVVGVTWYEAMAYCAWLHQQLAGSDHQVTIEGEAVALGALLAGGGWQVRLPGEAEWEWAAGGPGHTRYPWGRNFDPERANTLEGRVLAPSPVGVYPAGAAKCGALDLSGNVWEWCHSLYRPYPYRAGDGREEPLAEGRRTLRGGSWNNSLRNARVAVRDRTLPVNFGNRNGFRVVVAPIFP